MGLFGGFKANFISKIKKKHKKDNVVCLKYNVYSEFGAQTYMTTSELANHNAVVESKQSLPSSVHQQPEINQIKNSENSKQDVSQIKPLNYYKESNTNIDLKTIEMYEKPDSKDNKLINNDQKLLNQKLYSTQIVAKSDNYTNEKLDEKYEESLEKFDGEKSTLIFMTQASLETEKNQENGEKNFEMNVQALNSPDMKTEQREYKNFKINNNLVENPNDHDEYKVNVVQYDFDRSYSISEDELSDYEEDAPKFKLHGYSSQAASIFFGEQTSTQPVMNNERIYGEEDC